MQMCSFSALKDINCWLRDLMVIGLSFSKCYNVLESTARAEQGSASLYVKPGLEAEAKHWRDSKSPVREDSSSRAESH